MAGAFLALDGAEGFLPDSEGAAGLTEGDVLVVRVNRSAQGGKGPRLTARLPPGEGSWQNTGPVGLIARGVGPLLELAGHHPGAAVLVDDAALLARFRRRLGGRLSLCDKAIDDDAADQIEELAQPAVDLPGGAHLHIHPTPALVAIDVDAGGAIGAGRARTAAHLAVNRSVIPALAGQIRLRNLSGAILVDFAGLPARRRTALGPALAAALADDPAGRASARLHRAWVCRDRQAARPSAVARTAGGSTCRRPGCSAAHRGRARRRPASAACSARLACGCCRASGGRRCVAGPCAAGGAFLDPACRPHAACDGMGHRGRT